MRKLLLTSNCINSIITYKLKREYIMNYQIEIQFKDNSPSYCVELRAANKDEAKADALVLAYRNKKWTDQVVEKVIVKKL